PGGGVAPSPRPPPPRRSTGGLADRLDDLGRELGEALEVRHALGLEPVDDLAVLLKATLPLVGAARLEELDVVEVRHRIRDLVAEVLVLRPRDRALGDALHAGRG